MDEQRETEKDGQRETDRYRDRQRQIETNRDRQIETDRQTDRDIKIDGDRKRQIPGYTHTHSHLFIMYKKNVRKLKNA